MQKMDYIFSTIAPVLKSTKQLVVIWNITTR